MSILKSIILKFTSIFPSINWFISAYLFRKIDGALEGIQILLDFKFTTNRNSKLLHRYIGYDDTIILVKANKLKTTSSSMSNKTKNQLIRKTLKILDDQIYPLYFFYFLSDIYIILRAFPLDYIRGWKFLMLIIVIAFEFPLIAYIIIRSIRFKKTKPIAVSILTLMEWLVRKLAVYTIPIFGVFFSIGELQRYLRRIGLYIMKQKSRL